MEASFDTAGSGFSIFSLGLEDRFGFELETFFRIGCEKLEKLTIRPMISLNLQILLGLHPSHN